MLYFTQFKNFEDFNTRFGYSKDLQNNYLVNKNGVRQRLNNVIYQLYKESILYSYRSSKDLAFAVQNGIKCNSKKEVFQYLLKSCHLKEDVIPFYLENSESISEEQLCELPLGVFAYYQYRKGQRILIQVKLGRYLLNWFNTLKYKPFWASNVILLTFFIEEFVEAYKRKQLQNSQLQAVIDKDFKTIYSYQSRPELAYDFHSCMDDKPNWKYYQEHQDIYSAVSLRDASGKIYARALLVKCFSENGNSYTLLDRIYSNKEIYKYLLFNKLNKSHSFDIYKYIGAAARDTRCIIKVGEDHRLEEILYIPLDLQPGDVTAFQDTFFFYCPVHKKAYNTEIPTRTPVYSLANTKLYFSKHA